MATTPHPDLTRTTLAVLFIGLLILFCFYIVSPFLSPLLWAVTMVIATWPLFLRLQSLLWGKRWLAVLAMTGLLLLVLIIPLCYAVVTILRHTDDITGWFQSLTTTKLPPPPAWVQDVPVVGATAVENWTRLAEVSPTELSKILSPYATKLVAWFVAQAGNIGMLLLHFLLSIAIAAVLFYHGESAASGVRQFARRLASESGDEVAILSANAIRGVALGIVVTALVQSFLGGVGLFLAGVPAAGLLTAVMLMFCIAQLGPGLVLIAAIIWLFYGGHYVAGSLFAVWSAVIGTMDNFLRPILIRKGVDLPMLLIISGVLGGLISFGIIGLFIGPVILAVTFTLLKAWVTSDPSHPPTTPTPTPDPVPVPTAPPALLPPPANPSATSST